MIQYHQHNEHGVIQFTDARERVYSELCQPRDVTVLRFDLDDVTQKKVQHEIAAHIRAVQQSTRM